MNQFDERDERAGHEAMLARIRADRILDAPEPQDHERWSRVVDDATYAEPSRTVLIWCCAWHELHPEVRGHADA